MPSESPFTTDKQEAASLSDYFKALPLYLLPQHFLSRLMFSLARCRFRPWKDWLIRWSIRHYGIDMSLAREDNPAAYSDFNQFFTRELREGTRPIAVSSHGVTCPVDGTVSQVGEIRGKILIQAKGRHYALTELLAGDPTLAQSFSGGSFITLYLSPRDYHRIHMPLTGKLVRMIYIPGRLFAVNAHTARVVPKLFARNERVVNLFETEAGPMALIMVGAIFVGGMETVWAGPITPVARQERLCWTYGETPVFLHQGDEMGRFNMGSTVVLLFGPDAVRWSNGLEVGTAVQMGQSIGMLISPIASQAGQGMPCKAESGEKRSLHGSK